MNYLEWAPQSLIALHKNYISPPITGLTSDEMVEIAREDLKDKDLPDKFYFDDLINSYSQSYYGLGVSKEDVQLLNKLLTDLRMKPVWLSLSKRVDNDLNYYTFWSACRSSIEGWRKDQKFTPKEKRNYYIKMHNHAMKLSEMIGESPEFKHYSIDKLIKKESIEKLLESLDANPFGSFDLMNSPDGTHIKKAEGFSDNQINYSYFSLSKILPHIRVTLIDVAQKAYELSEIKPLVKKPNTENAGMNYFMRHLSSYLQHVHGQPLHNIVSSTTSVVFDTEVEIDLVKKIVK